MQPYFELILGRPPIGFRKVENRSGRRGMLTTKIIRLNFDLHVRQITGLKSGVEQ